MEKEPLKKDRGRRSCLGIAVKVGAVGFLLIVLLILFMPSESPCPTDEELIGRFRDHKAEFVKIAADPKNQQLLDTLGIRNSEHRSGNPAVLTLGVYWKDHFGVGWCEKGYAYSEEPLKPVVKSLDEGMYDKSSGDTNLFRHIEGNWYLFYFSTD